MTEPLEHLGIRLRQEPAEFSLVRHIEYFDGPLLSEFRTQSGDPYLFIWRTRDSEFNRWLVVRTTKRDIALYENLELTLGGMMKRAVQAFLVDVDGDGVNKRWWSVVVDQLPPTYLPSGESWFDPDLRPTKGTKSGLSILIDGNWELQDIVDYPRKYRDVYSVTYLLGPGVSTGDVAVRESTFNYLLEGGYVYHSFFTELAKAIPHKDQTRVRVFQYSSPGIIEMDLNKDIAAVVTARVRALRPVIEPAKTLYNTLYKWHRAQRALEPREPNMTTDQAKLVLRSLVAYMGFIDLERLERLTRDLGQTVSVVLACFRRISTLIDFEVKGLAKLVDDKRSADEDDFSDVDLDEGGESAGEPDPEFDWDSEVDDEPVDPH